jgi:archaellum biogenesis ATPase FlaH
MGDNKNKTKEKVNYNTDIQRVLISYMLSDPEAFVLCQPLLDPKYFDGTLQPVIKFILNYAEKYKGLPTPALIYAETHIEFLLVEPNDTDKQWFLDTIELFCRHKACELALIEGADMVELGSYGDLETLLKNAVLLSLNRDLGTDYFKNPRERLEKMLKENGNISTGWKSVDDIIYRMGRGELAIFAAVTGGGKSVAMQNLAINWAMANYNIVYFTFELSESLVSKRLDAMITGIPNASIFRQIDKVEIIVKQKEKHCGAIHIKALKLGTTTNDLRAYLKEYQIQNKKKPDMIIVDHLDHMYANSNRIDPSNLFIKDKYVSEELRDLGREQDAIVITASQITRNAYDELNPTAAHIAGGISKANTCDLLISISNTVASRERGEIGFHFMKTRNSGGTGRDIALKFDVDTLRITDPEDASLAQTKASAQHLIETSNEQPIFDATAYGDAIYVPEQSPTGLKDMTPALERLINKTRKD